MGIDFDSHGCLVDKVCAKATLGAMIKVKMTNRARKKVEKFLDFIHLSP
jgi:hypothetical protein